MSEILLAKPKLPEGWIDTSVGEPYVVREILDQNFDLGINELRMLNTLPRVERLHEYPLPTGYPPLVEFLEKKHGAPVIISNGAKQALGACFYAIRKMGYGACVMRKPYWALIPPLSKMHDVESVFEVGPTLNNVESVPYLLLAPNNPDGHMPEHLTEIAQEYKEANRPLIHDAAYYTHSYLPRSYKLEQLGDVQIYSVSKMLGLSGLRIGYAVCSNPIFYRYIQEYMEAMTVGVSNISQIFLEQLFKSMERDPKLATQFEDQCLEALIYAKKAMLKIDPEVLEVPANVADIPGMFGWFKVGAACNFNKAKVNVIDGSLFGMPGMVRINLGFNAKQIDEIVRRLNEAKGK